tara:strand:+ start:3401 stop:3643 length:243 start_codon:yes stop_codon:yes gene_type:complete
MYTVGGLFSGVGEIERGFEKTDYLRVSPPRERIKGWVLLTEINSVTSRPSEKGFTGSLNFGYIFKINEPYIGFSVAFMTF